MVTTKTFALSILVSLAAASPLYARDNGVAIVVETHYVTVPYVAPTATAAAVPATTIAKAPAAAPTSPSPNTDTSSKAASIDSSTLEKAILAAAPGSSSCSGASFPSECRTASQAASPIANSFSTYSVTSPAEQAALIALMLYESGEFKYNQNHWPGVPGQGTRNMQSPAFNKLYATSLFGADKVAAAGSPAGVLELVSGDKESFASAAWFVTSQCSAAVRSGLQSGSQSGWEGYLTGCVGTSVNADRNAYWTKVKSAMGV